jgi:hypothetical protein
VLALPHIKRVAETNIVNADRESQNGGTATARSMQIQSAVKNHEDFLRRGDDELFRLAPVTEPMRL